MTCGPHSKGLAPGAPLPYQSCCDACLARRGHLPEGERDVPASAAWLSMYASRAQGREANAYRKEKRRTQKFKRFGPPAR